VGVRVTVGRGVKVGEGLAVGKNSVAVACRGVGVGVMSGSKRASQASVTNTSMDRAVITRRFIGFIVPLLFPQANFRKTLDKRLDLCYHVTITFEVFLSDVP
jgi:hypothetical protein